MEASPGVLMVSLMPPLVFGPTALAALPEENTTPLGESWIEFVALAPVKNPT